MINNTNNCLINFDFTFYELSSKETKAFKCVNNTFQYNLNVHYLRLKYVYKKYQVWFENFN